MVQSCLGLVPTYWYGAQSTHYPGTITIGLALSAIFSIPLIAMVRFDYGTKRKMTGLFSTQITDEEFLRNGQGSAPYYGVPALLMGGIVSLVSFSIAANCITAAYFYVFLEGGGTNEISMACYLQWYTNGSLLNGHIFAATFIPSCFLFLLFIVFKIRPKQAEEEAQRVLQVLNNLEGFNGTSTVAAAENDSKTQILWADSMDCIRAFATAKLLQNVREENSFPPFHLSYADKYGHEEGQVGLDEIVTVKNAIAEGVENVTSPISVEPVLQKNIDDVWHLPSKFDNFFDAILVARYVSVSSALGLSDFGVEDKVRMNRLRLFFASLMKSLKADGRVIVNSIPQKDIKKSVKLFKEAGYKVKQIIHKVESFKLQLPFGILPNIYKEFPKEDVFTICAQRDFTILENLKLENDDDDNRATMCAVNNTNDYDKEEVLLDQTQILYRYYFWVFVTLLCYLIVLVLTIAYWDKLQFPGNAGMPQYFAWNILGLLQNAPLTFMIEFKLLYDNMTGLPRATSEKIHMLGFVYVVTAYIVATIQTLPYWIFSIIFRYYFLQEVIGLPSTDVLSSVITGVLFTIIVRYILVKIVYNKEEEEEYGVDDPCDSAVNQSNSIVELTDVVSGKEKKLNENVAATSNPIQQ